MNGPTPRWVPADALLTLHDESVETFGGAPGLRDRGGFESAHAAPQNFLAYEPDATLARLAAAYAHALTRNHPFVDGNKRAAFMAALVFLELNGYALDAEEVGAYEQVLALTSKELDEEGFAAWIESKAWKLP